MKTETEIMKADHEAIKHARRRLMQLAITYNQDTNSGYYDLDKLHTEREIGSILVEILEAGKQSHRDFLTL